MRRLLIKLLIIVMTLYIGAELSGNISIDGVASALIFSAILLLVNGSVKPLLSLLSLPIVFLSLGLFLIVINTWMIMLADWVVRGVNIEGFFTKVALALVISLLNSALMTRKSKE